MSDQSNTIRVLLTLDGKQYAAGSTAAAQQTEKLGVAVEKTNARFNAYGKTQKEVQAAMRVLPAQITDIVTGLASGQSAYLVAIQQGGQLKDSFGGVVPAARALLGAISPLTLAVGAGAAVIGTAIYAYVKGAEALDNFTRAVQNTGNYAGFTAQNLSDMSEQIADITGSTRGTASSTLGNLLNVGTLPGDSLKYLAQAALEANRTLGTSVEDIQKNYEQLARSPLAASLQLNTALHYLNGETVQQIDNLVDAGKQTDAARLALLTYAQALMERSQSAQADLSGLARAWDSVKTSAAEAWNTMTGFAATAQSGPSPLANLFSMLHMGPTGAFAYAQNLNTGNNDAAVDAAQKQRALQDQAVAARASLDTLLQSSMSREQLLAQELQKFDTGAAALRATGSANESDIAQGRTSLIAKILGGQDTQQRISEVERALTSLMATYQNTEKSITQAHNAGAISDEDYYSQRIKLINDEAAAQVIALQRENQAIAQQAAVGDQRIANQEKIRDNLERIRVVQEKASAEGKLLSDQQAQAQMVLARAYEQSEVAAQNYLDTLARGYERKLQAYGEGPAAQRYLAGRSQIDDQYLQQSSQLQAQSIVATSPDQKAQLQQQLALLKQTHQRALQQWDTYFAQLERKQREFSSGFREAMLQWADQSKNAGAATGDVLTGALDRANQSTAELLTNVLLLGNKGGISVRQIAAAFATDMVQGLIQVGLRMAENFALQAIFGAAGVTETVILAGKAAAAWSPAATAASVATFGAADAAGLTAYLATLAAGQAATTITGLAAGREYGGVTAPNSVYRFRENRKAEIYQNGDELILATGSSGGRVTPASALNGSGQRPVINVYNQHSGAQVNVGQGSNGEIEVFVQQARLLARADAFDDAQNNGPVTQASNGRTGLRRLPKVAGRR